MSADPEKHFCNRALLADQGSREYAKRLGERLKDRTFVSIFPQLAQGFLEDRRRRMNLRGQPTDGELNDIQDATLTLLYRLLFLLYAESRELLPVREGACREASLQTIKEEIADKAGIDASEVAARIAKTGVALRSGPAEWPCLLVGSACSAADVGPEPGSRAGRFLARRRAAGDRPCIWDRWPRE